MGVRHLHIDFDSGAAFISSEFAINRALRDGNSSSLHRPGAVRALAACRSGHSRRLHRAAFTDERYAGRARDTCAVIVFTP